MFSRLFTAVTTELENSVEVRANLVSDQPTARCSLSRYGHTQYKPLCKDGRRLVSGNFQLGET